MAVKTERELAPSKARQYQEIIIDKSHIPEFFATMLTGGFLTTKFVRIQPGQYVRGVYQGMTDGELSMRPETGETPAVKWIHIKTADGIVIRLLGAYNLIQPLETQAVKGDVVVIARDEDISHPSNPAFRMADYFVMIQPSPSRAQSA